MRTTNISHHVFGRSRKMYGTKCPPVKVAQWSQIHCDNHGPNHRVLTNKFLLQETASWFRQNLIVIRLESQPTEWKVQVSRES